jgi:quercetin dioxygenase-like cupin family protein
MPIVDCDSLPEILMRAGVSGRWLSGSEHGAQSVSVLRNWVEPGVTIPRHLHDQEEIVLVEQGEIWVEIDGHRHQAGSGQTVIIPPRATHAWGTAQGKAQVLFIWPVLDPFASGKSTYLEGKPPTTAA